MDAEPVPLDDAVADAADALAAGQPLPAPDDTSGLGATAARLHAVLAPQPVPEEVNVRVRQAAAAAYRQRPRRALVRARPAALWIGVAAALVILSVLALTQGAADPAPLTGTAAGGSIELQDVITGLVLVAAMGSIFAVFWVIRRRRN